MKSVSKDIYKKYQAQTFPYPSLLEVKEAKGSYIKDIYGKKYLDFVAGVSACSIGHSNKNVIKAVKNQLDKYSHVMVYGEYIQDIAQSVNNKDTASSLKDLRCQIDKLDDKLIDVLQDRMDLAELIGVDKKTNDITILQPERWKYILEDRLRKGVAKGLSDEFIILLLRAIHQESINIQTRVMNSNK